MRFFITKTSFYGNYAPFKCTEHLFHALTSKRPDNLYCTALVLIRDLDTYVWLWDTTPIFWVEKIFLHTDYLLADKNLIWEPEKRWLVGKGQLCQPCQSSGSHHTMNGKRDSCSYSLQMFAQASSPVDVTHTSGISRTRQCPFYWIKKELSTKKGSFGVFFVSKKLFHSPTWKGNTSWFHLVHLILSLRCALISDGWSPETFCTSAHTETRYCTETKYRLFSKLLSWRLLDGEKLNCASIIFHLSCTGNLFHNLLSTLPKPIKNGYKPWNSM